MAVQRTTDQDALLERIHQHLAELDAKFRFANRLSKENSWSLGFTYEVINEYAKFLFLAKESGQLVVPPFIIDQAWHLHLLYTEAYWTDFCPKVLGMSLHHVPATKSKKEAALLEDATAQTLLSYRKFFGEPHPLWTIPKDKVNRALLYNIAFALSGIGIGLLLGSALSGTVVFAFIAILFGIPALVLFNFASHRRAIKHPYPRVHTTTKGAVTCGGSSCATQDNSGGGHSCGGH